ncbi:hypothetical protein [Nocardia goodfellowii]|uniref:Uncharacterized protein n=1 Tax=Nocardia goodfellowii TaxID=882446 RepID=A0ABS4QF99_9NOCA|nr:hypothetical protein [Nocardia goodfellowii]MBP2189830.1 hypothetical protein [Nocardia goodfellowii]
MTTVRAYYPGDDWFVVGADRAAAIAALHAEFDRRIQDPAYVAEHWARTQRHLNGEVTPGFEVRELSTEEYERRTTDSAFQRKDDVSAGAGRVRMRYEH